MFQKKLRLWDKLLLLMAANGFLYTVRPLLRDYARDFENWPVNRGWPFKRGMI